MNLQTIKTDDYWLLIDKSHKENCSKWTYSQEGIYISTCKGVEDDYEILAHLPIGDAPLLEGVLVLPELPKQEEDVTRKAELAAIDKYSAEKNSQMETKARLHQRLGYYNGYQDGYEEAPQGKMYNELLRLLTQGRDELLHLKHEYKDKGHGVKWLKEVDKYLQPISSVQEQEWVFEMDKLPSINGWIPKTIPNPESPNNPILVGKWLIK